MSKAAEIMNLVKKGLTFEQIIEEGYKERFIQITMGKNGYDWRTMEMKNNIETKITRTVTNGNGDIIEQEATHSIGFDPGSPEGDKVVISEVKLDIGEEKEFPEDAIEIKPEKPLEETDIDKQMEDMAVNQQATQLAKAMKLVMENPQSFLLAMGNIESESKGIIKRVEKCHRCLDVDVKPGESCPKCIQTSIRHEEMTKIRDAVLPCPKCGDSKKQALGGTIKSLIKPGHYSCGNCKISYNASGEKTEWGENDRMMFEASAKRGLY